MVVSGHACVHVCQAAAEQRRVREKWEERWIICKKGVRAAAEQSHESKCEIAPGMSGAVRMREWGMRE